MQITSTQTQKILKGNHSFSQLGFSMLITRLKNVYTNDPSQGTLEKCTKEINAFLAKFTSIMSQDYAAISNL